MKAKRVLAVTDAERWFNYHVIGSLIDQGHEVETFTYGPGSGEFYGRSRHAERLAKNQALVDHARRMKAEGGLDLIFCYVYDDFLTVEHARQLAAIGVPMVNYNVDMVNQWYRQIRTAPYFALILCAHRANMDNVARHGGQVLYFPMASRPPLEERHSDFVPAAPVTFLGTPMEYRIRVLAEIERVGIPLAVYGHLWSESRVMRPQSGFAKTVSDIYYYGWPRLRGEGVRSLIQVSATRLKRLNPWKSTEAVHLRSSSLHGALPDGALDDLFRRSTINLGITRMIGDDPATPGINQVKLRDFEVPLAGGFYLVEEADDHAELFAIGKEIETWRTPSELIEKIRHYCSHETERAAIAQAGHRRTLADHTWKRRFDMLFDTLGIA